MAIKDIQAAFYRIPLAETLSDATHGDMNFFHLVTVRLIDDDGAEGVGYTYTVDAAGDAIRSLIERDLAPLLIGEDPRRIEQLWERMWWRIHYPGRGGPASFAISAIDIALWDLCAKRDGLPLWMMLGGHDARVPAYAGGIDLMFPLDRLLAQTERNLARGFRAIKMKVGRPHLVEDVERVKAMREFLGAEIPLLVDVNMRWTVDEAIRGSHALAAHDVFWLEEPTIPDDIAGHVRIEREGPLPVATGENFHTLYEFRNMINAGGVSYPEPDVSNCGGITVWRKVAALAEANNLKVTSHGVHDLHVHLLAAAPNKSFLEVHGFGLENYIAHPLEIIDGFATAPDRPGHGVEFDWKGLEPLAA